MWWAVVGCDVLQTTSCNDPLLILVIQATARRGGHERQITGCAVSRPSCAKQFVGVDVD
jgi:hypothetical protein